jgi:hypothetical protein
METQILAESALRDAFALFLPVLAPVGVQVGTEEWVRKARSDIEASVACILFLSAQSVRDPWVARRLEWAFEAKRLMIPVLLDDPLPDESHWSLPEEVHYYNRVSCKSAAEVKRASELIASVLPKPRTPVICFVSYSRVDSDFVARLRTDLSGRGLAAWRDVDDIPAAAAWDSEIEAALQRCSHILLVVSSTSMASANVADEVGYARDRKKPIIPLLLDDTPLPLRVHRAQAIDFRGDYGKALQKLVSNLRSEG